MLINRQSRQQLRLQSMSFLLLFLVSMGLLAYLAQHYNIRSDWTNTHRNSLSKASLDLLNSLDSPLSFRVFATENETLRKPINDLINQYRHAYPATQVRFINTDKEPSLTREQGIRANGEVIISYGDANEHLIQHSEQAYSDVIQRLARNGERFLVFISGHGERSPHGVANHDLSDWAKQLGSKGFNSITQNLIDRPKIPDNAAAVVIASPAVNFLEAEVKLIIDYLAGGGNLLWLIDPGSMFQMEPLAQYLSLEFINATVVDPSTQLFGISDPRITLISKYPFHEITQNFEVMTLYPQARPIKIKSPSDWQAQAILQSLPRSWAETGKLAGTLRFDSATDVKGPITIGVALTKTLKSDTLTSTALTSAKEPGDHSLQGNSMQRIVVIGDADFLSNQFLGNAANLDFGLQIANWLSHDDSLIAIPAAIDVDSKLNLSSIQQVSIAFGFLIILPLIFAASGAAIWLRRRKR